MGQLRSALSAASRSCGGPARVLEILELYADSVVGAENTTVASAVVDWDAHHITYSVAGHLPPALLRGDGTVEFLDRATDPPLGARCDPGPWPQAAVPFTEGAFLVLYTDGLIERRNEDIDTGLDRLAASLTRHHGAGAEVLADALLAVCCRRRAPTTTRPSSSSRCRRPAVRAPRPGAVRRPRNAERERPTRAPRSSPACPGRRSAAWSCSSRRPSGTRPARRRA
ncbi:PP2C family protein-serine/threonine phosphatase [Streptomyces sp. NPDC056178]|uniref:PP2C family protein-serine/threonine phosphatase n=1 Tax=Streptomyces sp. NPDC056178 TaxID=3345735 RepID=UPI0035D982BE